MADRSVNGRDYDKEDSKCVYTSDVIVWHERRRCFLRDKYLSSCSAGCNVSAVGEAPTACVLLKRLANETDVRAKQLHYRSPSRRRHRRCIFAGVTGLQNETTIRNWPASLYFPHHVFHMMLGLQPVTPERVYLFFVR